MNSAEKRHECVLELLIFLALYCDDILYSSFSALMLFVMVTGRASGA